MKKFLNVLLTGILCLTLLATPCASSDVASIYYSYNIEKPQNIDKYVKEFLVNGWQLFDDATNGRMGPRVFQYTSDVNIANIVIYCGVQSTHPAVAQCRELFQGQIEVFWDATIPNFKSFYQYSADAKAQIMCHEWSHIVFHLPDEYEGCSVIKTDCIMGNFHVNKWTGRYCTECQSKVDAICNGPIPK